MYAHTHPCAKYRIQLTLLNPDLAMSHPIRLGLLVVWSPGWQVRVPNRAITPNACQSFPPAVDPKQSLFSDKTPQLSSEVTQNKDRCGGTCELLAHAKQKPLRSPIVFLSWLGMHLFNSLDKNMAIVVNSQQMYQQHGFNDDSSTRAFQDASLTFRTH